MTEDVNFGHRDQAADIDDESEISRARMVEGVAVRGAGLAARVAAHCAGNTTTTPDRRLRYLVGAIAAPVEAEVGGTHQKHGRRDHRRHASVSDIADLIRAAVASLLLLSQDDSGSSLRCQVPDFKEMLAGD